MAEETILLKAFKFFDLDGNGTCTPDEFMKALIRIGLNSIDEENKNEIFNLFDVDGNGVIDYKEFVQVVFGDKEIPEKKTDDKYQGFVCSIAKMNENKDIFDKIRKSLNEAGDNAIFDILDCLLEVEKCDKETFAQINDRLKFNLDQNEIDRVFSKSKEIPTPELIAFVSGKLNNFKKALVDQAYKKLNPSNKNELTMERLFNSVFMAAHPRVVSGEFTIQDVTDDFKGCFELFHKYYKSENISLDEFMQFYELIALDYPEDVEFENLINSIYKMKTFSFQKEKMEYSKEDLEHIESMGKNTFNEEIPEEQRNAIIKKFEKVLKGKSAKGIVSLLKSFKRIDENNSFNLDYEEYRQVMYDFLECSEEKPNPEFTIEDIDTLFDTFNYSNRGFINYKKILFFSHGGLISPIRRKIVESAFSNLDADGKNQVELRDLKGAYHSPSPNIIPDLLETLEIFHITVRGSRRPFFSKEEFVGYYNLISFLFPSDDSFIKYICDCWRLNEESIKKPKKAPVPCELGNQKKRVDEGQKKAPYGTVSEKIPYVTSSDPTLTTKNKTNNTFTNMLEEVRKRIRSRGIRGIMSVRRAFFMADEDDSKNIDLQEFGKLFDRYKFKLTNEEKEILFKYFDKDNSNTIEYNEFLDTLLGKISDFRMKIIKRVFEKLDQEQKGYVTLNQIRYGFNAKESPSVRAGVKKENEILGDFIDLVEYHFNLLRDSEDYQKDGNGEMIVDSDAFVDFFRNISVTYEEDKDFEMVVATEWGLDLDGRYPYQKGWNDLEQ